LPTETVLERQAESTCPLVVEISEEHLEALRNEHARLSREATPTLSWDRFLHACLAIGLDRLQRMSALEAFELADGLTDERNV
jgi:hypothetical protein